MPLNRMKRIEAVKPLDSISKVFQPPFFIIAVAFLVQDICLLAGINETPLAGLPTS